MTDTASSETKIVRFGEWRSATKARITDQIGIVSELSPGSDAHRVATSVLLMLQDSLFILSQTDAMIEEARKALKHTR